MSSYSFSLYLIGCQVEIFEDRNGQGSSFTCHGNDGYRSCDHHSFGYVGDDEASSIKCTCPREFDYVEYAVQPELWEEMATETGERFKFDEIRVYNPCDPVAESLGKCADATRISSQACFQSHLTRF